jgi:hypothetical protein
MSCRGRRGDAPPIHANAAEVDLERHAARTARIVMRLEQVRVTSVDEVLRVTREE